MIFMKPLIIVNFKGYASALGKDAVELARLCEDVSLGKNVEIGVAPALCDLGVVAQAVHIPVFSQHVDAVLDGSFTGHVGVEGLCALGVKGTLLNHSERPLTLDVIQKTVELCRTQGIVTVVCAASLEAIKNILEVCVPDYIAYESPELIGGALKGGSSVMTAQPDIISHAVALVKKMNKKVNVLCGAGVQNEKDVATALQLGTAGVLVSSAVVKAKDRRAVLNGLVGL